MNATPRSSQGGMGTHAEATAQSIRCARRGFSVPHPGLVSVELPMLLEPAAPVAATPPVTPAPCARAVKATAQHAGRAELGRLLGACRWGNRHKPDVVMRSPFAIKISVIV